MHDAAISAVRGLVAAGADNIRLLNFNIFPGISSAQLASEHEWNFTLMDEIMDDFMSACGNASVIVDIDTSPAFLWLDANASMTHTCADAFSDTLSVGPRRRCPHWGDAKVPRDPTWGELTDYFRSVALWYTNGSFVDSRGHQHIGGRKYKFKYWEILNEGNIVREHGFTPQSTIDFYDAQVHKLLQGPRPSEKFLSASWAGISSADDADQWVGPFLNKSRHRAATPIDAVSIHTYSSCMNHSDEGLEQIFPVTDKRRAGVQRVDQLRKMLNPDVEIHMTESGIICNKPRSCQQNNYSCWYSDFSESYWLASGTQWIYQFLTYTHAVDLTTVAQSQVLGYPFQYEGLSGEWPCGSMVDWKTTELNAKYWAGVLTARRIARPYRFCDTSKGKANAAVYLQAIESSKGRVVVVLNKRRSLQSVTLEGAAGKEVERIDATSHGRIRSTTLSSDRVTLEPFATAFVIWSE